MRRSLLIASSSVLLMAGAVGVTSRTAQASDNGRTAGAVGRSWIAAVNRGDVDAAVALVGWQAVFDIGGTRYRGRAAIRRWITGDPVAAGGRYTILRVLKERRAAVFTLDFRAVTLREGLRYRFVAERRKIVTLTARYR